MNSPVVCDQVGVIGRTGAGKSSVINALFRLNSICGGCVIVDDVDIADCAIRDLRSHFAVVPQSPFCLKDCLGDTPKKLYFLLIFSVRFTPFWIKKKEFQSIYCFHIKVSHVVFISSISGTISIHTG